MFEKKGTIIRVYNQKFSPLYLLPGLIFCLVILAFFFLIDKPWEKEQRQAELKMHADAREEFKNNLPDDYLSRCKVDYINASKDSDFFESHPENFDALTQIIKSAPIDHHHTGRSHKFGYIYFTNFESPDYVIVLDFNSYYKSGYVCIKIYEGDPHTSNFVEDYYSEELLEWARENFPEEFEKMKDLKPHWFFGNIALYVFLALGFLPVLLNSISGKKR